MRKIFKWIISLVLVFVGGLAIAQQNRPKFGDIKPNDFLPTAYAVDSSANGVVLFDIGSTEYEGSNNGWFDVVSKRHTRIRLLNRNSFDMATYSIPLYSSGSVEERIESLDAVTYNLENGKIVTYKLDKNSIFKDRYSKYLILKKFTLPNLQEGSIIEIKYRLVSPYARFITPWVFQGPYPVIRSEYSARIPTLFDFVVLNQGFIPYQVNTLISEKATYNIIVPGAVGERSEVARYDGTDKIYNWVMENIPSIKRENYITTLDNYISKISFALANINNPNGGPRTEIMGNWNKISLNLMKDEDFGDGLLKNNGWMKDELKTVTAGTTTQLEAAKKIFNYVRDNITCSDHSAKYLSGPIKKALETKQGNVADINLLLTALMLKQGIEAHPVLLSTRDHGNAWADYPMLDKFNYVITQIKIDDREYLLDASESRIGFGNLPLDCYNGYARVINPEMPKLIDLSADSIKESKLTTMFIINGEKGKMEGSCTESSGNVSSQILREKLMKTSISDFFKEVKKSFSFDMELKNTTVDSLKNYEQPVVVKYDFSFDLEDDILYINPMLADAYKDNIFNAAERNFPVEMPYAINENFVLRMEIPTGYAVEELPKSTRVKFNENEGIFEYIVAKDATAIQFRSTLKLNKANFMPEDYESLRDFFGYVVKKHSEQIVLKKIKS